jgi:hypothetical protein
MAVTKLRAGKQEPPDQWMLAEELLSSPYVRTTYAWGPPGIGKTFAAYRVGRITAGLFPITLTPEMPASELLGHYVPRGDGLAWHDAPFALALRAGGRLIINELSHASSDVLAILYPVLESVETAQLMMPTGEILRPAEGFNVVATDNEPPDGLPEALRDRFDCVVHLTRPHPAILAALHPALRRAAERAFTLDSERRVSTRQWMAMSRLLPVMGPYKACIAVLGVERGTQIFEAIVLAEGPDAFSGGAQ